MAIAMSRGISDVVHRLRRRLLMQEKPDVMMDLPHGIQTAEEIACVHEAQAESLQRFVEGSYSLLCL
jgi:hypothetical protein